MRYSRYLNQPPEFTGSYPSLANGDMGVGLDGGPFGNWYRGSAIRVILDGQDVFAVRPATRCEARDGAYGHVRMVWELGQGHCLTLHFTVPEDGHAVFARLDLEPGAQPVGRVEVRLTCYPGGFGPAYGQPSHRWAKTAGAAADVPRGFRVSDTNRFPVVPIADGNDYVLYGDRLCSSSCLALLLQHENKDAYRQARDKALAYLIARNVEKGLWGTYHEDFGLRQGTHLSAELMCYTAEYLIRSSAAHPEHLPMARRVLKQMEDKLVFTEQHGAAPAPGVAEQSGFEHIMAGHTARYGACLAQLYLATGDEEVKRRALSTLHGVTHMQTDSGIFVTFFYNTRKPADDRPKETAGPKVVDRVWFSQHLFSIYNLLGAMAVFPQLAPDGQDRILHHTTALRDVSYAPATIGYTATAPAQVKAKLSQAPKTITLDGQPLPSSDRPLSKDSQPAWHFDTATQVLTLHHSAGKVEITR